LAERFIFYESGVEVAEVFGESAVVDAAGFVGLGCGCWYSRVEKGPLVLQGAAVGGALG